MMTFSQGFARELRSQCTFPSVQIVSYWPNWLILVNKASLASLSHEGEEKQRHHVFDEWSVSIATWLKVRILLLDYNAKEEILLKKLGCSQVTQLLGNHFLARYRQLSRWRFHFSNKWRRYFSVVRGSDC